MAPFMQNMTIFSAVSVYFDISFRWAFALVCHELRTENEGICPRLSKYLNWNTIDLHFLIKLEEGLISAKSDTFFSY